MSSFLERMLVSKEQEAKRRKLIYESVQDQVVSATVGNRGLGLCLYYAAIGCRVLKATGVKAVVQAGSAQWRFRDPKLDAEPGDTHFAYMWDPGSMNSLRAMRMGNLPEMHVWLGCVETQEVIDFSTGGLAEQCKLMLGQEWTAEQMPPFVWMDAQTAFTEKSWAYLPNGTATMFALKVMKEKGLL